MAATTGNKEWFEKHIKEIRKAFDKADSIQQHKINIFLIRCISDLEVGRGKLWDIVQKEFDEFEKSQQKERLKKLKNS